MSSSGPMDWGLMMDMEMEAQSDQHQESTVTLLHDGGSSSTVNNRELPIQTQAETPPQEVEIMDVEVPYGFSTRPVHARWPPPNNWRGQPSMHQRLDTAHYYLNYERQIRMTAEQNSRHDRYRLAEAERNLQEQRSLRFSLDKEVQRLNKSIKSLSSRAATAKSNDVNKDKDKQIRDLIGQLQVETQRADFHKKEVEKVRLQLSERVSKDLTLIERLTVEKHALEEEMEEMKVVQKEACRLSAEQLEVVQRQLEEKTSSSLELASRLKIQQDACLALEKKVEMFKEQMKLQVCELITKTSPSKVNTKDITEVPTPEKAPETEEKPSRWRRFKKSVTPKHRRQYKNKKQDDKQNLE